MKMILLSANCSGNRGFSDAWPLADTKGKSQHSVVIRSRKVRKSQKKSNLPTSPDSMYTSTFSNVDDQVNIGIVVVVRSTGHLDVLVGHTNVLSIDRQIFGGGHHDKLDGSLKTKRLVCPFADGANLFDCRNTVVADQDTGNDRVALMLLDEFGYGR